MFGVLGDSPTYEAKLISGGIINQSIHYLKQKRLFGLFKISPQKMSPIKVGLRHLAWCAAAGKAKGRKLASNHWRPQEA